MSDFERIQRFRLGDVVWRQGVHERRCVIGIDRTNCTIHVAKLVEPLERARCTARWEHAGHWNREAWEDAA